MKIRNFITVLMFFVLGADKTFFLFSVQSARAGQEKLQKCHSFYRTQKSEFKPSTPNAVYSFDRGLYSPFSYRGNLKYILDNIQFISFFKTPGDITPWIPNSEINRKSGSWPISGPSDETNLFYQPQYLKPALNSGQSEKFNRLLPMRLLPEMSDAQMNADSVYHPHRPIGRPGVTVYPEYPEVELRGLVSDTFITRPPDKVEIFGFMFSHQDGDNPNFDRAMRLQTFAGQDIMTTIYDVVPVYGTSPPGLAKTVLPNIPKKFHAEFISLLEYQRQGVIGSDQALNEFLSKIGLKSRIEREELFFEILKTGREMQYDYVQRILGLSSRKYRERRGNRWSDEKIAEFDSNGFATMDNTRYVTSFLTPDRIRTSFPIPVANMGMTVVNYGKVRFFCKNKKAYVEIVGPFGSTHAIATGKEENMGKIAFPMFWHHPVGILPVETDGFLIDRPAVVDFSFGISQEKLTQSIKQDKKLKEMGYDVDTERPISFYTGRVVEPVKFVIDEKLVEMVQDSTLPESTYNDVLARSLMGFFPREFSDDVQGEIQKAYTYNTREGKMMYYAMGFTQVKGVAPKIIDGEEWYLLEATPHSIVKAIKRIQKMKSAEAKAILDFLENDLLRKPYLNKGANSI